MRVKAYNSEAFRDLCSEVRDYAQSMASRRACMGLLDSPIVVASHSSGEVYVITEGDTMPDDCEVYATLAGPYSSWWRQVHDGLRSAPVYKAVLPAA